MDTIRLFHPRFIHKLLQSVFCWMMACVIVFFGAVLPTQADIYKWRDATGVIYYSNHPPADLASIIEIIPSQNAASDSGAEPKAFYLAAPGGQPADSFTIPPDVLQELFNEQTPTTAVASAPSAAAPDLITLTMRLAEVEQTLQQEVETRLQWQQQYAQAQLVIKTLEQQNRTLNLALANLEENIDFLRGTVVASDLEVSALKQRIQPGQYVMLENTVTGIQEQVQTIALELESLNAPEISEKVTLLAADVQSVKIQQDYDYALHLRLTSLEDDLQQMRDNLYGSDQTASLVTQGEPDGQTLEDVSRNYAQRLEDQQLQIAALEAELDRLKTTREPSATQFAVPGAETQTFIAQLADNTQFLEALLKHQAQTLQTQNEQIKAIQAQLPAAENLETTAAPSSGIRILPRMERRRTSLLVRFATWLETPQPQLAE